MELKPCPFCGGKAEIYEFEHEGGKYYSAGCSKCMINTQGSNNAQDVINKWNKRNNKLTEREREMYNELNASLKILAILGKNNEEVRRQATYIDVLLSRIDKECRDG